METLLSATQIEQFRNDGYLVFRRLASPAACEAMLAVVREHVQREIAPVEYEAELGYPGAPASLDAPGGRTIRRLRSAYQRDTSLQAWAQDPRIAARLRQLFGEAVCLTLAHHNSVMTKHPGFGTATGWHRDIRYWSFARNDLIAVWLALGPEFADNGALHVIPGSHRLEIGRDQLDELDFLRPDVPKNQPLIAQERVLELQQGDVVFFHSGLFHAAGRNATNEVKSSVVFAYRGMSNPPLAGSRSAASGEIVLG
ncbi:phytanoyl-CoA dioxygenase family protein [Herbaspirillum sp. HC18]|nr:phytanoyl-CoA dioxygenase family protein [Herbaspirillum sp. HC18]